MCRWGFPGSAHRLLIIAAWVASLATSFHASRLAAAPIVAPTEAVFLFLFEDSTPTAGAALRAANREALQAARVALCETRQRETRLTAARRERVLQEALPSFLQQALRVEMLPGLAALLAFVPLDGADIARAAWQDPTKIGPLDGLVFAGRLGDSPPASSIASGVPGLEATATGSADNAVCSGKPAHAGPVLAIFDNGAAADHPWLKAGLGRLHFQSGTPGGPDSPGLRRSHGTAMLGIYAQAALGLPLRTDGALLLPDVRQPVRISATLIALAGPETPAGQVALARNLDWMVSPAGDRPFPDLLNYSQGNGPVCTPDETPGCPDAGWAAISRLVDRASADYAVLVVKSAGNAGFDAVRTRVTVPGDSFNALVVGNVHAFDWRSCKPGGARAQHRVHRQSSASARRGPSLIDLAAPGVRIDTAGVDAAWCRKVCENDEACAFCRRLGVRQANTGIPVKRNSGTSPAAAIAGVAALRLMQKGLVNPLAVKAVLMNSADAWDSHGIPVPDVALSDCGKVDAASTHGPAKDLVKHDRLYGRGYLDSARALAEAKQVVVGTLESDARRCFALSGGGPWKLTLTWAVQSPRAARPVSLSLRELLPGNGTAAGHRLDNTLQLGIPAGTPARTAEVSGTSAPLSPLIEVARPARTGAGTGSVFALAASTPIRALARCP